MNAEMTQDDREKREIRYPDGERFDRANPGPGESKPTTTNVDRAERGGIESVVPIRANSRPEERELLDLRTSLEVVIPAPTTEDHGRGGIEAAVRVSTRNRRPAEFFILSDYEQ